MKCRLTLYINDQVSHEIYFKFSTDKYGPEDIERRQIELEQAITQLKLDCHNQVYNNPYYIEATFDSKVDRIEIPYKETLEFKELIKKLSQVPSEPILPKNKKL